MNNSTVSVIMPVYNGEQYLSTAIESALNQTYKNIQLIIVNDCSIDSSDEIINTYLPDPRITYLQNKKNIGVAGSRNIALANVTGELVAFHDQDDCWLPNKLSLQISALTANPEVGLLHAKYARIDETGTLLSEYSHLPETAYGNPSAPTEVSDVFEEIFISNDIQPLTTIIPKTVLDEVGWFNPDLPGVDDYELWLRIAYRYPVGHLKTIVGFWRKHETQQSNKGYRMLLIRLKAMDIFLAAHPDAKERVARNHFIERMHSMNRGAANHYLYNMQDYGTARLYFLEALKLKPADVNSLVKLIYCSLPSGIRNTVRRIKTAISPRH